MDRVVAVVLWASVLGAQQSPQELLKHAYSEQQAGHLDEAIRDYQSLAAQYPNIALLKSNLGAALAARGRYSEAIAEYGQSLRLENNSQVRLNLALSYYKSMDLRSAIETLKAVLKAEPFNWQATSLLADSYLQLGENKNVIALLTPLQKERDGDRSFAYLLGTALVRDGQTEKGQVIIDRILRDGDSAQARLLMGTTKMMVSDFSGARDEFQKAVALDPKLPDVYSYYGLALLTTGDQAGARAAFEQELKANPNNFEANLNLGVILRHDEQYAGALGYLNQALTVRPHDPGVRYQIASIELAQDRIDKAQHDLEALLRDEPSFLEAHVTLATVYFREKRKEDGQRERAIYAKLNAERQARNEIAAKPAP